MAYTKVGEEIRTYDEPRHRQLLSSGWRPVGDEWETAVVRALMFSKTDPDLFRKVKFRHVEEAEILIGARKWLVTSNDEIFYLKGHWGEQDQKVAEARRQNAGVERLVRQVNRGEMTIGKGVDIAINADIKAYRKEYQQLQADYDELQQWIEVEKDDPGAQEECMREQTAIADKMEEVCTKIRDLGGTL